MVEVWEDEKSEIEERFSFLGESFYANVTILPYPECIKIFSDFDQNILL